MPEIILPAAAVLALLYWAIWCYRGASWPKSAVKTGSVLLLAATGGPWLLTLALILCALGDFLLSREGDAPFMAGVGAFAAGHLAYVALFLTHAGPPDAPGWLALPLTLALVVLGLVMARILWPRAGDLRIPVMLYIPIILSMGIAALQLPFTGLTALALPAALLFIASDLALSMEMFVLSEGRLRRFAPFFVWPSYWGAQALFTQAF